MIDLLWLLASAAVVLAATCFPSYLALRTAGADRLVALGLAPSVGAGVAGVGAILASALGVRWSLLPFLVLSALAIVLAALLRRVGVRLPRPVREADGTPYSPRRPLLGRVPHARWWLLAAAALALVPIAMAFGSAGGVLERWDTLYHLSAIERARVTGDASTLHLGAVSNSAGRPVTYPAAFHDLATVMPWAPTPVLLNGATAVLAVVPWVVGIALLARVLWPQPTWGPFAAALIALVAPATPVDEWVHLSPIPNLTGFAMLPGLLAAAVLLWRALWQREGPSRREERDGGSTAVPGPVTVGGVLATCLALGAGGMGLALLQPNCAVLALLLLAVLTASTSLRSWRRRPLLALLPIVLLVPVAVLTWTPLASMVTGFTGGLIVPWWQGVGEVLTGLLTVWPMAIGAVLALLWWPGLVRSWRSPQRWLAVAWVVVAVLYVDAAVDSPLNLSILFYRGQDRLAMPLTMLTSVLAVPGLQAWSALLRRDREGADTLPRGDDPRREGRRGPGSRALSPGLVLVLVLLGALLAGGTVSSRLDHARMNAALEYPGRGRFLQPDELTAFATAERSMDRRDIVLASPFSGAAHLYGLYGQSVRFPVAGMSSSPGDAEVLAAAATAATDPAACRTLEDAGIGYVYQEHLPYQYRAGYERLNLAGPELGSVVFTTDHSRLIKVECDDGR